MLLPWMIVGGVNILWCIISIILLFALPGWFDGPGSLSVYGHYGWGDYDWGQMGSLLVSILMTVYFEMVVFSLYNKLNDYHPAPQII